jgi:hypothetical protein
MGPQTIPWTAALDTGEWVAGPARAALRPRSPPTTVTCSGPRSAAFVTSTLRDGDDGVSVLQHATAASAVRTPDPVSRVTTAEAFTDWVSKRPFLTASTPRRTTFSGQPAWTVDVTVPPRTPEGPAVCENGIACYPVVYQRDGTETRVAGVWAGMSGSYTALEFAGAGIVVVWSWSLSSNVPDEVGALVDSIRFD